MPDGSIVLSTALDNTQLEKELSRLTKKIESLEAKIAKKTADRNQIAEQLKAANDEAIEVYNNVERLQNALKKSQAITSVSGPSVDPLRYAEELENQKRIKEELAEQEKILRQKEAAAERLTSKDEKLVAELEQQTAELNEQRVLAGEINDQLHQRSTIVNRLGSSMSEVTNRIDKLGTRISKLAGRVFVFSLITNALRSLRTWLDNVIKSNSEATSAIARLKGALLTLAQPLVNVIIPAFTAFVNVLAEIVSAIAKVVSALFGTTVSESAKAAENLYNEMNAIEGVGEAAEEAAGQLAGFDEINQLAGDTASGSAGGIDAIFPDFSLLGDGVSLGWLDSITQKLQDFASSLRISFTDVFLDWDNLTGEQIAEKIIVGLSALAGGVAGFMIGGVPGAIVGTLAGGALGLVFDSLLFDHDGTLSKEEVLSMIVAAAGALAGGIIGFTIGGPGGAAIGVLVGGGLGVTLSKLVFDRDGTLSQEEVLTMIVAAANALAGGVIGFVVGGPLGAAIGVTVGAGLGLLLSKLTFDGDGKVSPGEIFSGIANAIRVITGGILGFRTGGGTGAVLGISVGSMLNFSIEDFGFDSDGTFSIGTFLKSMVSSLADVVSGVIGLSIGGTAGGGIAMTVRTGLEFIIEKISALFSGSSSETRGGGRKISDEFEEIGEACADGFDSGLNNGANETSTGWVTRIIEWVKDMFGIHSPSTVFAEIGTHIMEGLRNGINSMFTSTVVVFTGLWANIQAVFAAVGTWFGEKFSGAATSVKNAWSGIGEFFSGVFSNITSAFSTISTWFRDKFTEAWQAVKDVFSSGGQIFDGIKEGILDGLKAVINALITGINKVISVPFNGINSALRTIRSVNILGLKPFSWISTISIPQIPKLATGAVIPPNREFLAVLGDQKSGNNIEAPESLIRKIVREEAGNNDNSALLQAILEALKAGQTIMVGDTVFGRTAIKCINGVNMSAGKQLLLI